MSKKNLSLLMDGFMGEANQAERQRNSLRKKLLNKSQNKRNSQQLKMISRKFRRQHLQKHLLSRKQPKRLLPSN